VSKPARERGKYRLTPRDGSARRCGQARRQATAVSLIPAGGPSGFVVPVGDCGHRPPVGGRRGQPVQLHHDGDGSRTPRTRRRPRTTTAPPPWPNRFQRPVPPPPDPPAHQPAQRRRPPTGPSAATGGTPRPAPRATARGEPSTRTRASTGNACSHRVAEGNPHGVRHGRPPLRSPGSGTCCSFSPARTSPR